MIKWKEYKADQARECFDNYCRTGQFEYDPEFEELRSDLVMLFRNALDEIGIEESEIPEHRYQIDLYFGMKLYMTLNVKYGMNTRYAATEGIWRYLSIAVVPDLVDRRYGKDHPDRFWKKPKRLWLRVLWWYIHLSWQGTEHETLSILKENSTDEILQLVDRCGRDGFRVNLYRELMKKNSEIDLSSRRENKLFRKTLVLNTARVQSIEPELVPGGNRMYVESLYGYFLR